MTSGVNKLPLVRGLTTLIPLVRCSFSLLTPLATILCWFISIGQVRFLLMMARMVCSMCLLLVLVQVIPIGRP